MNEIINYSEASLTTFWNNSVILKLCLSQPIVIATKLDAENTVLLDSTIQIYMFTNIYDNVI